MTAIPDPTLFNASATEGAIKTNWWQRMENYLLERPDGGAWQELEIAAGVVTPALGASLALQVDSEGAAGDDILTNIAVTNNEVGAIVYLRIDTDGRSITVDSGFGGSGQILLAGGQDFLMTSVDQVLVLKRVVNDWVEIGRASGNRSWGLKIADVESLAVDTTLDIDLDGKTYELDGSTVTVTATLPPLATVRRGAVVAFYCTDLTNACDIDGDGVEVVDLDQTFDMLAVGHVVAFQAGATKWLKIHEHRPALIELFTASGTWTRPKGVRYAEVWVTGAGGGGGGGQLTGPDGGAGGGGGAMAFASKDFSAAATHQVTIGAGGTGGTATGGGASGGQSNFSAAATLVSANGGGGGTGGGDSTVAGGLGGTTTVGDDIDYPGATGANRVLNSGVGREGGSSPLGGGGAGGHVSAGGNGGRGAGGGGGAGISGDPAGGAGGAGRIVVRY